MRINDIGELNKGMNWVLWRDTESLDFVAVDDEVTMCDDKIETGPLGTICFKISCRWGELHGKIQGGFLIPQNGVDPEYLDQASVVTVIGVHINEDPLRFCK